MCSITKRKTIERRTSLCRPSKGWCISPDFYIADVITKHVIEELETEGRISIDVSVMIPDCQPVSRVCMLGASSGIHVGKKT